MIQPPTNHLDYAIIIVGKLERCAHRIGACKASNGNMCCGKFLNDFDAVEAHFKTHIALYAPSFSERGWRAVRSLIHRIRKAAYYRTRYGEEECWSLHNIEAARSLVHNLLTKYIIVNS